MPCLGRALGGGKGAPSCVSSGQLIPHPSHGAKGLHPGLSSAPVCPLLLHSVTVGLAAAGPSWVLMGLCSKMDTLSVGNT